MPDRDIAELGKAEAITAMDMPHVPEAGSYLLRHENAVSRIAGMAHGDEVDPLSELLS
jgi:hypothetical protein